MLYLRFVGKTYPIILIYTNYFIHNKSFMRFMIVVFPPSPLSPFSIEPMEHFFKGRSKDFFKSSLVISLQLCET